MATTRGAVTIRDVAALAGVSRQTVTRSLNDMADVSAATKARVIAAAVELNYRPNRAAQSMVQGRRTTIGLVLEDLANPYFAELASALTRVAADAGWSVLLCDIGADSEKARVQLASIVAGVDALVLTGCNPATFALLPPSVMVGDALRLPMIMLDGAAHDRLDGRIVLDARAGIEAALDHLIASGRRRIAFIDSLTGSDDRRDAFHAHMERRGLSPQRPDVAEEESLEGGMRAATRLLEQSADTDAVLVYNDVMAVGALKTLARLHRAVPSEIAVIGIDGLELGRVVTPELTTLAIDKVQLAAAAVSALEHILDGSGTNPPIEITMGLTLIERDSS